MRPTVLEPGSGTFELRRRWHDSPPDVQDREAAAREPASPVEAALTHAAAAEVSAAS